MYYYLLQYEKVIVVRFIYYKIAVIIFLLYRENSFCKHYCYYY